MLTIKKIILTAAVMTAVTVSLFCSKTLSMGIVYGTELCLNALLPSIFPFLLLSEFIAHCGAGEIIFKPFGFIVHHLFRLNKSLTSAVVLSFIGGYPVGARQISFLLSNKVINKSEAERAICFCFNAGPAFAVSAVGVRIFGSIKVGIILFLSLALASIAVGFISSLGHKASKERHRIKSLPLSNCFTESVWSSAKIIANLSAFVICFSALIALFKEQLTGICGAVIIGALEVTNSLPFLSGIYGAFAIFTAVCLLSFGGLSVHVQVFSILSEHNLSFKKFYVSRILHAGISLLICTALFRLFLSGEILTSAVANTVSKTSYNNIFSSAFMLILAVFVLFSNSKKEVEI